MRMRFLGVLLVFCLCVLGYGKSFLQELAETQAQASELTKKAFKQGGNDGLKWNYYNQDSGSVMLDISTFQNPAILIVAKNRATMNIRGNYYAVIDGKRSDLSRKWFYHNDHAILRLEGRYLKGGVVELESKNPHVHIWVSDYNTIHQIWDDYLVPNYNIYKENWVDVLEKDNVSGDDFFYDLRALKGDSFPTDLTKMAKMYASNCASGYKAEADRLAKSAASWEDVETVRELYFQDCKWVDLENQIRSIDQANVELAIDDLDQKYPDRNFKLAYGDWIYHLNDEKNDILTALKSGQPNAYDRGLVFLEKYRSIMLSNPLLDDLELLAIRRKIGSLNLRDHALNLHFTGRKMPLNRSGSALGTPSLSTHSILQTLGNKGYSNWQNDLVKLSDLRGEVKTEVLYKTPEDKYLISNARTHWDGNRVAFTMGAYDDEMSLFELDASTGNARQLSPRSKDHFVDSCYLPDGNIVVMSTAIMTSLPCEGGSHMLANMYLLNPETQKLRQLGIDQENSYHATVQDDGRVMYVRYEYADTPHYYTRVLMNMNPDGTNQREIYGSNSVWPTSMFYPRQVPGHSNLFTAVVSGHHGPSHMGRLVLFDTEQGRREANGAVQFIGVKDEPVEADLVDVLYGNNYPKHMYSIPLDAEYYLSLVKRGKYDPWGLYLVDRFDNLTLIHQPEDHFIAWPQVFNKRKTPPVIPTRVREDVKQSTLYIQDIYEGPGLAGIERGMVKELAVYALHYGYQKAATHNYIGIEGPWDARYLLGTVPVNEDGSAIFNVPAMMPISLSPLDEKGMALQKMRSWINPQPGEVLSCIGCHETMDHAPLNKGTMASRMRPLDIKPWYGEARPYSFVNEVQPVLDRFCIGCHDGAERKSGKSLFSLKNNFTKEDMLHSKKYSIPYQKLQKYVRRNGPESDYALLTPMGLHASSSKLIQMLQKGHHGVELDDEAWRRLYMWIDLNVPFHAAYHPLDYDQYGDQTEWRQKNLVRYAGLDWNPEKEYGELIEANADRKIETIMPVKKSNRPDTIQLNGWPISGEDAREMQLESGGNRLMILEFGQKNRSVKSWDKFRAIRVEKSSKAIIEFVKIPAGSYVMGSEKGYQNETPRIVEIKKAFWMSTTEITNEQMQAFDPGHDSRFADIPEKDQQARGVPLHLDHQPAVRVSHKKSSAFCEWLSEQLGKQVKLPTEEQWEWASRAGTGTDMWYGNRNDSFEMVANLSDRSHRYSPDFTRRNARDYFLWVDDVEDGFSVSSPVKQFQANAWGLYDMVGNAEEWTSSIYEGHDNTYVVKGGSWFDLPKDARSACRWGYHENIRLPDLGFRVIIEE